MSKQNKTIYAWIGNWGMKPREEGYGITQCIYEPETGHLTVQKKAVPQVHVGHMQMDGRTGTLYCVDEQMKHPDFGMRGGGGNVYALAVGQNGRLMLRNHQYSYAPLPSYTCIDRSGHYLLLTNHSGGDPITVAEKDPDGQYQPVLYYSDASLVLYEINEDGSIGRTKDLYKVHGHGKLPGQDMPHLHSVVQSLHTGIFFVCDKGCNKVYSFKVENGQLQKCDEYIDQEGSAPRYSVVVEEQNLLLINHEHLPEITALRFDADGKMEAVGHVDLLPKVISEEKKEGSDLKLSPDGRYLYSITRGVNYVSVVEIGREQKDLLTVKQIQHFQATTFCGGGARGCAISPDGKYFYICVADDGAIHRFGIRQDGTLDGRDQIQYFGNPANMIFQQYP